ADTTVFHLPAWHAVIAATYGHRCDYWLARRGDAIAGVFPVTTMRLPGPAARLRPPKLLAMPYQLYSGLPVAADEAVQTALVRHALVAAKQQRASYLEIRHHAPAPFLEALGFVPVESGLVTTAVPLPNISLKSIRRNHRRNIKKSQDAGLTVTQGETLADLRLFRRLYQLESRALGAPQAGWRFYQALHDLARDHYRLFLAWQDGRCIAGMLTLDDGRTRFARLAAYSSPEAQALNASHALYWAAIADGAARGCTAYNCGISWVGDEGLIHWKEGWNGRSHPVHLYVYPLRGQPPAPGGYFEGFQLAKAVWRRLPLPLADWLGQQVTTWVG
ncbi:MAG: GNAT family N-acetyltransferase, partial [Anaerolineales bacterium]|nr:GNAT family N-acetyltransferase [Anaerolineales bacterium]